MPDRKIKVKDSLKVSDKTDVKGRPELETTGSNLSQAVEDFVKPLLEGEVRKLRAEFILIFGLFASLVTFLAIEVKIFDYGHSMSQIMGISSFFLAALMLFILTLRNVLEDRTQVNDWWNPATVLTVVLLVASAICFMYSVHHPYVPTPLQ